MSALQVVEVVWTIVAAIGLVACFIGLREAVGDRTYLRANNLNGRRLIVAQGLIRREALRLCIQLAGGYIGIYALGQPNPPDARLNFLTFLLVAMQVFTVINTVLDQRDRARLIAYWKNVDLRHIEERDKGVGSTDVS